MNQIYVDYMKLFRFLYWERAYQRIKSGQSRTTFTFHWILLEIKWIIIALYCIHFFHLLVKFFIQMNQFYVNGSFINHILVVNQQKSLASKWPIWKKNSMRHFDIGIYIQTCGLSLLLRSCEFFFHRSIFEGICPNSSISSNSIDFRLYCLYRVLQNCTNVHPRLFFSSFLTHGHFLKWIFEFWDKN